MLPPLRSELPTPFPSQARSREIKCPQYENHNVLGRQIYAFMPFDPLVDRNIEVKTVM